MKKFIVALIIFAVGFCAFAQQTLLDIDGRFWIGMSDGEKGMMAAGWLMAMGAVSAFGYDMSGLSDHLSKEENTFANFLLNWGSYSITPNQLVEALNYAYSFRDNMNTKIWQVILSRYEKDWWDQ